MAKISRAISCGTRPTRAGRAEIAHDVVAVDKDLARCHRHGAADDTDQRRLAGAVRAEQRENLAFGDIQIDRVERDEARS